MKIFGYCLYGAKQCVAYTDRDCGIDSIKVTDGFHDKMLKKDSVKAGKLRWVKKSDIDLERIVKRIRGARPWHPLLGVLREEVRKS